VLFAPKNLKLRIVKKDKLNIKRKSKIKNQESEIKYEKSNM
jgi:hypothetical protein